MPLLVVRGCNQRIGRMDAEFLEKRTNVGPSFFRNEENIFERHGFVPIFTLVVPRNGA